jgi:hypothetical protein
MERTGSMRRPQPISLLKGTIVLLAATAALVFVIAWSARAVGFHHPIFALVVSWVPNGLMVATFAVRPFSLPDGYYRVRPFERRLYKTIGVGIFRKLLRSRYYRLNPEFSLLARRTTLDALEERMRDTETAHLVVFLMVFLFIGYAFWTSRFDAAAWLLVFNLLFNGYPIMLQRYNRTRVRRLLDQRA